MPAAVLTAEAVLAEAAPLLRVLAPHLIHVKQRLGRLLIGQLRPLGRPPQGWRALCVRNAAWRAGGGQALHVRAEQLAPRAGREQVVAVPRAAPGLEVLDPADLGDLALERVRVHRLTLAERREAALGHLHERKAAVGQLRQHAGRHASASAPPLGVLVAPRPRGADPHPLLDAAEPPPNARRPRHHGARGGVDWGEPPPAPAPKPQPGLLAAARGS